MNSSVSISHSRRGALRRPLLSLTAALAMIAPLFLVSPPPAFAADPLPDGLSSRTAAGSCWEAKQNDPKAADGVYWILTPALTAPQQFYCDMTTDGGGWVLVARGREGWKGQYNGLGSPVTLRTVVDGVEAFKPAELPAKTVDGLLNNGRVDALPDGVRVRRAMNQDGSQRQEVRFAFANRDRWVWTFGAVHPVGAYSFDGSTGSGGKLNNFGKDQMYQRVDMANTSTKDTQGYLGGISYGEQLTGSSSDTSFLWSRITGGISPRPFAQMFLRPKLTLASMTFAAIPDQGAPAVTQRALPESDAIRTVWGVSGLANGRDGEENTEVAAFGQQGDTVFVGGNFQNVQRSEGATGADSVHQEYLAGFDVNTGELVAGFRPTLNGQVKAIIGLPDGRLAVGGQFSQVNGEAHQSLVVLDPVTGAVAPGWQVTMENRTAGGISQVRGFSIQGDWLYLSGSFTHLTPTGGKAVSEWNGARINLTTGIPDSNWNPALNGTSIAVDASAAGDRTYFAGYFSQAGSIASPSAVALQTTSGAQLVDPVWKPRFSEPNGAIWQLGVAEAGGRVWLGGSQHSLFTYDHDTFSLMSGAIARAGGDMQTVISNGDTVFAGCHCGDWIYSGTYLYPDPGPNFTQGDKINLMGAWDAKSGDYLQEFSPVVQARNGNGSWALFQDSNGTLWSGGDFSRSIRAGEVNQWSGGFIRFAARDTTAPSAPGELTGTAADATSTLLSWPAATDDRGAVTYEVIRENKVIESTRDRQLTVPAEASPVRYFVRAVDDAGNRSATTKAFVVSPPPANALTLVDSGQSWTWRFDSAPLPSQWNQPDFDDSSWKKGSAVLGFGAAGLGTDISTGVPAPRPLSAQFRHSFTVTDPTRVTNAKVSVIADDGVVVYVNGTEVGRANLPTGPVTQNTYATAAPRSDAAAAAPALFDVPSSVFVAGTNVVSASTQLNYRSSPNVSFDLRLTAEEGDAGATPPAAPVVTGEALDATTAKLSWTHDPASQVVEYQVSRDGSAVGVVQAPGSSFTETGLTAETAYDYTVTAIDSAGQHSTPGSVSVTTPAATAQPGGTLELIKNGSAWKWHYDSTPWPADWRQTSFDDSSWATGASILGWNTPGLGTDISVGAPDPRPLAAQFRSAFTIDDPTTITSATVTVLANDGAVVYLNGTEIGRANLPTGEITQNTYATSAPNATKADASKLTINVPIALLQSGTNVIAASTHLNYKSTRDVGFDLALTAQQ